MRTRRVALIILYNGQKSILLQDRRGISKAGEEWGYFGGEIEEGETPEQAVVRETMEELGYELKEPKYLGRFAAEVPGLAIEMYVFTEPLKDNAKLTQTEGSGMRFFSLEEATKLNMGPEGNKEVLRALKGML